MNLRNPRSSGQKGNAGSRFTRDPAFSRVSNQTKAELCVTVVFSELWFLSIPKSLRHVPLDDQLIHPKDLAVDLCLWAIRNSKVESRKFSTLAFLLFTLPQAFLLR